MSRQRKRVEQLVGPAGTFHQRMKNHDRFARAMGWGPPEEPTPPPEPPAATPPDDRCTFCGGRAVKSDRVAENPEQVLFCCKRAECLSQWRPLVAGPSWYARTKRRRRRRRRARTREP